MKTTELKNFMSLLEKPPRTMYEYGIEHILKALNVPADYLDKVELFPHQKKLLDIFEDVDNSEKYIRKKKK